MSVRARLLLSTGAIAAVLVLPAVYGLYQLREVESIASGLEGRHAAAQVALGNLQSLLTRADRLQREYVALREPATRRELEAVLDSTESPVAGLREAGYGEGATRLAGGLEELRGTADTLQSLVEAGETRRATARFERFAASLSAVQASSRSVASEIDRRSTAAAARAGRIARRATVTAAVGVGVGLLLAVGLGLFATRSITAPLTRLRAATESVAHGDFRAPSDLAVERDDELGAVSRAFAAMQERLADLDELRAELLGATSHRLKTPISVIQGYTEMLEDSAADTLMDDERAYLEAIDEQASELRDRVDRLLKLSRVEAQDLDVVPEPVPTRPLFDEVEKVFAPLARQQAIDFSVKVSEDVPETVRADPDRVRVEVVGNLLENAFRVTEAGGEVAVRVLAGDRGEVGEGEASPDSAPGEREQRWTIEVSDTGSGIPPADLERIFDRYYQVGGDGGGIGLGLAVARSVVDAHDGDIRVESEPGEGSTFRVVLPVV